MPANLQSPEKIAARDAYIHGREPRIPPLPPSDITDDIRAIAAATRKAIGLEPRSEVSEYTATVLRHANVFARHGDFARELMAHGDLSARDRELAILRTGWLCRAPFEWNAHVNTAKRIGVLTSEEIERVTIGSDFAGWSEHDYAILRGVEELLEDAMISDKTWAALARDLTERQLLELPILVGHYVGIAFLQNSVRVRLMPGHVGLSAR